MIRTQAHPSIAWELLLCLWILTRTYNWVKDNKYYITMSDIENLSDEDFRKVFNELKAVVEDSKEPASSSITSSITSSKSRSSKGRTTDSHIPMYRNNGTTYRIRKVYEIK